MSLQDEFRAMESGHWAEADAADCPCRGRGWLLSDLDTWHRCPIHGKGKPHPEDERAHEAQPEERPPWEEAPTAPAKVTYEDRKSVV